jgi:signal transduction histidine kinase
LPAGVDLVAFRIVQEALTNALKHAGPAQAVVRVAVAAEAVELDITDNGGAGAPAERAVPGTGHGLLGMRERVAVYGGELRAGHRPEGGFAVHARIPLRGAVA